VFRAASLSKPVFSYLVMKLVDRGVLDLDTPIERYLSKRLPAYPGYASLRDDRGHERLTARLLLSHQGGLPNWLRDRPNGTTAFRSAPGDRFPYSGEGYVLLQLVVETITGRDLATLAREMVFEPLGMRDSSFLWKDRFDGRFAVDLGSPLAALVEQTRRRGNAAGSLVTNAADYAALVGAVMDGSGLRPDTRAAWLAPQVAITSKSLFGEPGTDGGANRAHALAWTPGWGTFEVRQDRALFHVGMEEGCENFVEVFTNRALGVVFLGLTDNRRSYSAALVEYALGRAFSPLDWLEYGGAPLPTRGERLRWSGALALVAVAAVLAVLRFGRRRR
jgi:CubicO group peptidase (beta-lactamase class C family)